MNHDESSTTPADLKMDQYLVQKIQTAFLLPPKKLCPSLPCPYGGRCDPLGVTGVSSVVDLGGVFTSGYPKGR